jgi:nucleotide-binding universal stress UspA family protein
MSPEVTVGYDGSPQSWAAAEWAACEALSRRLPLRLIYVWDWQPYTTARKAEADRQWAEQLPRDAAQQLSQRHPRLAVEHERIPGYATSVLPIVAKDSELLALGSRALSGVAGFLLGSVAQETVVRATRPVVLVRAEHRPEDEHGPAHEANPAHAQRLEEESAPHAQTQQTHGRVHPYAHGHAPAPNEAGRQETVHRQPGEPLRPSTATAYRDVLLGLDPANPRDEVAEFAFAAAAHRATRVRVVHGWRMPSALSRGQEVVDRDLRTDLEQEESEQLSEALRPWREKFPHVEVVEQAVPGSASRLLVDGSTDASLVVVGRRERHHRYGPRGPRIGPITHAVLHHSSAPVAVVPHL